MLGKLFGNKLKYSVLGKNSSIRKNLVVLIILDGLGIHPDPVGNAVLAAESPFLDTVWSKAKSTLIHASGVHVGLPELEPGNSEVGHLNIGSGQVVYQSLPRINDAIRNGKFHENEEIKKAFETVKERGSNLHLMGILSPAGVHGHTDHLYALMDICKDNNISPKIHAFLDGRDSGLTSGYKYMEELLSKIDEKKVGRVASITGRFFAMDRDKRWERTQVAYDAIVGHGERKATDPLKIIKEGYDNDENDQIFTATTMVDQEGAPVGAVKSGDVVMSYNFREDRARQLTKVFVLDDFEYVKRPVPLENLHYVTMTGYENGLPTEVVFPPKKITESLAKVLADNDMKQLHIAETEKYMHVTYFLDGGIEEPYNGEDFFNIPSPKVFDYAETPAMSAEIIRDEVLYRLNRIDKFGYSYIVLNFSNPDMLGHTGNIEATAESIKITDKCTEDIVKLTIEKGGAAIIIADHGNCETMINRDTGEIDTAHTNSPVPFILVSEKDQCIRKEGDDIKKIGTGLDVPVSGLLADVAPTTLGILGVEQPSEMTGLNLVDVL